MAWRLTLCPPSSQHLPGWRCCQSCLDWSHRSREAKHWHQDRTRAEGGHNHLALGKGEESLLVVLPPALSISPTPGRSSRPGLLEGRVKFCISCGCPFGVALSWPACGLRHRQPWPGEAMVGRSYSRGECAAEARLRNPLCSCSCSEGKSQHDANKGV